MSTHVRSSIYLDTNVLVSFLSLFEFIIVCVCGGGGGGGGWSLYAPFEKKPTCIIIEKMAFAMLINWYKKSS